MNVDAQRLGGQISKMGLIIVLLWIGIYKFTPTEANLIKPLIENSPFFAWQLSFLSIEQLSKVIGVVEIIAALLMILEFKFKRLAQIGYSIGVVMFISTISFLFTTPNMFGVNDGLPVTDWFILKDIVFLGVCLSNIKLNVLFGK